MQLVESFSLLPDRCCGVLVVPGEFVGGCYGVCCGHKGFVLWLLECYG